MIYFQKQAHIRVLYKSGNSQDFWATSFSIETGYGGQQTYKWERAVPGFAPILLGVNDVEAVWQIGTRTKVRFGFPKKE